MPAQICIFPEDVCAKNHHDNPNSRTAFDVILPDLSKLQELVLSYCLVAREHNGTVTVKTVRADLNMQHQTASARLTELKMMELIATTERRHDGCGVVEITDLGKRALLAWQKAKEAN